MAVRESADRDISAAREDAACQAATDETARIRADHQRPLHQLTTAANARITALCKSSGQRPCTRSLPSWLSGLAPYPSPFDPHDPWKRPDGRISGVP
jgi:hypothetical protein